MSNLASRYLGLELAHPVIASASPLTATFDGMRRLEDARAAAVVMASLFEEQIRAEDTRYATLTEYTAGSNPEAATYFPELPDYRYGVSGHIETLRRAAEALDIPVIASLNGVSDAGWLDYAVQLEQAGAAALELNLYLLPTDPAISGQDIERRYLDIVRHVKAEVNIPVSVKLPPFFSSTGNFAAQLESNGADGVVLFNRFFRPDFDLETLSVKRDVALSTPADIQLPLTWIALLSRHLKFSLAAGTGVDSHVEVVEVPARRRRRRGHRVGAVAPWPGAHDGAGRRPGALAFATRIRVRGRDPWPARCNPCGAGRYVLARPIPAHAFRLCAASSLGRSRCFDSIEQPRP